MLCVLIRIASMRSFWLEHTACLHVKESRKDGLSMSLGMVPWLALVGSRCAWHGHFFRGSEGVRAIWVRLFMILF